MAEDAMMIVCAHLGGEAEKLGGVRAEEEGHDHAVQRDLHLKLDSIRRTAKPNGLGHQTVKKTKKTFRFIRTATKGVLTGQTSAADV